MAQQKAVEPVEEVDDLIDELQPGAKLLKGQYTITRYINAGGFGITYLAKDSLDRDVVIKECFPSSVCRRSKVMVAARSRAHTAELRSVIQLFVREARNLAKIVHPNIVAVHQVFEDNGTAYMAIDFIDGLDLQQIIDGEGESLTPEHVVRITDKLLAAVGFIHDHDMLHRDISPDNVLIDKKGEPILIDFGAAREHASKTTRAMSALRVVKDGYSPQEFYIAGSEQGPWSDLYALAATLYHVISGEAPVNGQARLGALAEDRPDPYVPLTGRVEGYPPGFLEAIDRAMSTLPKQRLQTAAEWLAMYHNPPAIAAPPPGVDDAVQRLVSDYKREVAEETVPTPPLAKAVSHPADPVPAPASRGKSPVQLVAGVAVALVVVAGGYAMFGTKATPPETTPETTVVETGEKPGDAATPVATASLTPATGTVAPDAKPAETATTEVETANATITPDAKPEETATAKATDSAEATVTPAETETTAAETAKTDPAATTEASADPAPADPAPADPAAAPAPTETATDTATVPVATATDTAPATETAPKTATETPTETAAATAATSEPAATAPATETKVATPAANQIAFAAWDVEMPFVSDDRMLDGKRVAVVTRVAPGIDPQVSGDWISPGVVIYSVNGTHIDVAGSLTVAVMNAMAVDPDGKARVVVEYARGGGERKTGLLTVGAVRLVNLQNGVAARVSVVDGAWKTLVSGVSKPELTTLKPNDVLFRDKTTSTPLDGSGSLETILGDLVGQGVTETAFSVIRDDKVAEATMQLTLERGQ